METTPPLPATDTPVPQTEVLPAGLRSVTSPIVAFGRFELLGELGEGGMGTVYRVRDPHLARELAVKVLRQDHAPSSGTGRRFLDEARITAQLQHPTIPAIHELGATEDGRPWLAMKLIKGQTLQELIQEGAAFDKYAIFESIAQGLSYAHSKGVIHRDLKPANIMVGAFGEVQIMDWGLAKPLDGVHAVAQEPISELKTRHSLPIERGDECPETRVGAIFGTPNYMAPEQAIGFVDKMDRRTDVFGLGGILCALLTGKPPYVSNTTESTRQLAAAGKLANAFLRLERCGAENDWVTLIKECLSPEPEDRPADAEAVRKAVSRLRVNAEARAKQAEMELVRSEVALQARQKRRRLIQTGTAILMLVLIGSLATGLFFVNEERKQTEQARLAEVAEREKAEKAQVAEKEERKKAEIASSKAITEEQRAKDRLVKLEKANRIVIGIFESLDPRNDVQGKRPVDETLSEKIDEAILLLNDEDVGDDHSIGEMQQKLGIALMGLGRPDKAIIVFQRSSELFRLKRGMNDLQTLKSMNNLACSYRGVGRFKDAVDLGEMILPSMKIHLKEHPSDVLICINNLGIGYAETGRFAESVKLFEEFLAHPNSPFGPDAPETLRCVNNLGLCYHAMGKMADALPHLEKTLRQRIEMLTSDDPDLFVSMNNLARGYE
ncbi:MAG: protein kinase domain-containing protein, partial [Gemmataceae bacterium]